MVESEVDLLPVVQVGEIPREESPRRWLIEGLWGASAVGTVAGHPKACKTHLALDMAVSVASATSCLGSYRVLEPGKTLVYLAEDSKEDIRERVEGLTRHRGISLGTLDLHVITVPSLRLDMDLHRLRLQGTIEVFRPRLLLLDPLVRLHNRNENDATEISELLSYLRDLQRRFDMALILVHHTRKSSSPEGQQGQSLRGSGDIWAWSDSALYLRRCGTNLILSMEHRAAAAPDPVSLRLVDTREDRVHLEVVGGYTEKQKSKKPPIRQAILEALHGEEAIGREQLRARLSVKNERLGEALGLLEKEGKIERSHRGWRLVQSFPLPIPGMEGREGFKS